MSRKKKILISLAMTPIVMALLFVLFIGPWPTYDDSDYANQSYYHNALEDIHAGAASNSLTTQPGRLQAGWAKRIITPLIGTPMGGYSARKNGKKSVGVHDDLYVRAMALSDGQDLAVLVGSDMLIIPPNLSEAVRNNVAIQAGPLRPRRLHARSRLVGVRW